MRKPPELSIVVPVYNEVEALPELAPSLVDYCRQRSWQIVFVDDGSRDGSGAYLDRFSEPPEIKVLHHKLNRGYGRAIKTGICNADGPYVVTMDSDGQHEIGDIGEIFQFALQSNADMVVGNRGAAGNDDFYRSLGKRIIRWFTRLLMPLPVEDLNSGFKLYRTELAQKYQVVCPNTMSFSDVITLVFVHRRDLVLQHPIHVKKRRSGKSTINISTAAQTLLEILNIILLFDPLRVFLPLSLLFIIAGLVWGTIVAINMGRGLSVAAMLSVVVGMILFVLGLLANQISSMRMERLDE
jgi:glycosyltransferase involved in cell wall biosynthesis